MKTVLIIDDDVDTAELVFREVEQRGHLATIALSADEALRRLAEVIPDAILLDLAMPGMDGWALLERVRSHPTYARTHVVVYTGHPSAVDETRLVAGGVADICVKATVTPAEVVERLLADGPAPAP